MNTITELHDIPCPMRDGVNLTTDILMPTDGGPFPTVLIRLPYDRGSDMSFCLGTAMHLSKRGYAVVIQDTRGRYDSEGKWYPFINEVDDGHDTVKWVANQSWCDGNIGTSGASYFGLTQW